MKIKRSQQRKPLIPINAMSDIGFLLLIFIMLVSLINYRVEVKIDYPEAQNIKRTQETYNLELWIDESGSYFIDGKASTLGDIEKAIVVAYAQQPATRVHVISDRKTAYRHVAAIVEILQLLQHRQVSFVVK